MTNENEQPQIFDDWLKRHAGLMFKVVRAYAFNPQDQEDLFQEIARQVWNSIPNYRGEAAESTWLYRVAFNSAIAWTRREIRHRKGREEFDESAHTLKKTEKFHDERLTWLYEQIAQLDEIDRSLTLLMLDGFSYRDMATTLGITESNVGVKINRIKKQLTNKLNHRQTNEP